MRKQSWILTVAVLVASLGVVWAATAAGDLDDDFGTQGVVIGEQQLGVFRELAVDAQNRTVTIGTSVGDLVIQRFTSGGSADSTFGSGGVVIIEGAVLNGTPGRVVARDVVIASDGRIYVCGYRSWLEGKGRKKRIEGSGTIVCLNGDGSTRWTRDTDDFYDVAALCVIPAGTSYEIAAATTSTVTVESSGGGGKGKKGGGGGSTSSDAIAILQIDTSGDVLSTIVDDVSPMLDDSPISILVDASGSLVVGFVQDDGDTFADDDNWWGITRYLSSGSVDTSFATDGRVLGHANGLADLRALALDDDGSSIVAAGRVLTSNDVTGVVVRYDEDGVAGNDFSTPGFGGADFAATDVLVDAAGNILVVMPHDVTDTDIAIVRYSSSGSLDTTFGPNADGVSEVFDLTSQDFEGPVAVDGLGRIVMAGMSIPAASSPADPVLVRWK